MRRGSALVAGAATCAVLAACTGGGSGGSAGPSATAPSSRTGTATSTPTAKHVAQVAVLTSDTGMLAASGKAVRNSVDLALKEADAAGYVPGWSFDLVALDDGSTQSAGQQAAAGVAGTKNLIGVIGTLRSTIDEGVQPILNNAGVPMLSPGGTAVQLTRRADGENTIRPFPTYFRMSPTDADQGPAAARYASTRLHAKRVGVIDDGSSYGKVLARGFGAEARKRKVAVKVVRSVDVTGLTPVKAASRRARAAEALAAANVQAVFFGGASADAAQFTQAMSLAGVDAPLMGGDALLDGGFLTKAGTITAEGDYAVFPGAAPESLTTARAFSRRYKAAGYTDPPGPYGVMAYDATRALLMSFRPAVAHSDSVDPIVRGLTVDGLDAIRFRGASGLVTFDGYGDNVAPPLTLYRVTDGAWRTAGVVRLG